MQITEIPNDTVKQVALIRKVIKSKIPHVSVTNSRGTSWGWVDVIVKTEDGFTRMFTDEEAQILETIGLNGWKSNCALVSPEKRRALLERYVMEGLI
jgi:hypothetical protein